MPTRCSPFFSYAMTAYFTFGPTAIAKFDVPGPLSAGAGGDPAQPLHERLKVLLDIVAASEGAPDPIVGPPLYGRWHALGTSDRERLAPLAAAVKHHALELPGRGPGPGRPDELSQAGEKL